MTSILLIIQFVFAVLLTIVVLLQKSSSIGLGAYSGSNESVFGAKGPAGFLTKLTFGIGLLFIVNTLALGYFYNQEKKASIVDDIKIEQNVPSSPIVPKTSAPTAPSAPKAVAVPTAPKAETNQSK
jgi:preprotein translocase subunit SecG